MRMIQNVTNAFSLMGRVALVTGGGKGIGKGSAKALAQSGADVAIMGRDEAALKKTVQQLTAYGIRCGYYVGDVTKQKQAKAVVQKVAEDFGRLDILVNNAGIATPFDAMCEDDDKLKDWYHVLDVDLNGTFLMCHYAGLQMKKHGGGKIVNITSNSSQIVNVPQKSCSYNAAKAAADRLTKCLAYEWAGYGIRVNAVAPGYTETDLVTDVRDEGDTKGWIDYWLSQTPTGRFNKPLEIGAAVVFLASDAANQITGAVLTIDGGYMLAK